MYRGAQASVTAMLIGVAIASAASAQPKSAPGKAITHDITIKADTVYTGTVDIAIDGGKVTGDLRLTSPTPITGKIAGTAKAGVLRLAYPYHMTERNCTGNVKMTIDMPAKPGTATGIMEATNCGADDGTKVTGTIEMTPVGLKKK